MTDSHSLLLHLRQEKPADIEAIRKIHLASFPTDAEARLVDALRASKNLIVSQLGIHNDEVVGHVAFSPVRLGGNLIGFGLGPIAVVPHLRNRGIGGGVMYGGMKACRRRQVPLVVVLGKPSFYQRFGFVPASEKNLKCEFGGGDSFQVAELIPGSIPPEGGLITYCPEFASFDEPTHTA